MSQTTSLEVIGRRLKELASEVSEN